LYKFRESYETVESTLEEIRSEHEFISRGRPHLTNQFDSCSMCPLDCSTPEKSR